MHRQHLFDVRNLGKIHGLIRDHALGTLILPAHGHLHVDHLPFVLDTSGEGLGRLHTHAARDNKLWSTIGDTTTVDCMVVFSGPDAYISPSWYPSRHAHGKVQPSWYYSVVHAYGRMCVHRDRQSLARGIRTMTDYFERDRPDAWSVDEAPAHFIDALVEHIVGVEIEVTDFEGKWQVGQQRSHADRAGIVAALRSEAASAGQQLADQILAAVIPR
jgi:transcriptional regulator